MWSDKELDEAFRRLNPPEPEAESFPLDAWLRLEVRLDKQAMEREFRRRLWRFFAVEMLVVAVGALVWLAWPAPQPAALVQAEAATDAAPARADINQAATTAVAAQRSQSKTAANSAWTATVPAAAAAGSPQATASVAEQTSAGSSAAQGTEAPAAQPAASGQGAAATATPHAAPLLAAAAGSASSFPTRNEGLSPEGVAATKQRRSKQPRQRSIFGPAAAFRQQSGVRSAASTGAALVISSTKSSTGAPHWQRSHSRGKRLSAGVFTPASETDLTKRHPSPAATSQGQAPAAIAEADVVSQASASIATAATAASLASPGGVAELLPLPVALQTDSATALPAPLATLPVHAAPTPEALHQPRFYLGLLAAPDVSTVKMADYQAPTPNVGVLLEYRLTSRLRVNTGLLRSTKQYRARRQDYDWSYYPIAANGNFEWVDGRCTILDVPVNLRYDLLARPRYQVFGSAGLSSLFMQHETYAYDYDNYGTLYHWQSSFTNENQHWFSVLNLSAGYERNLGSHWRLQVEPYVKLPLGGVGAGKVRLMSGGVFFGVKYGL
jgi:hypothetical protein